MLQVKDITTVGGDMVTMTAGAAGWNAPDEWLSLQSVGIQCLWQLEEAVWNAPGEWYHYRRLGYSVYGRWRQQDGMFCR